MYVGLYNIFINNLLIINPMTKAALVLASVITAFALLHSVYNPENKVEDITSIPWIAK